MNDFERYVEQFRQDAINQGRGSMQKEVCDLLWEFESTARNKTVKKSLKKLRTKISYLKS